MQTSVTPDKINVLSLREVWESEGCVTVTQLAG